MNAATHEERCQFIVGGEGQVPKLTSFHKEQNTHLTGEFGSIQKFETFDFFDIPGYVVTVQEKDTKRAWIFNILPPKEGMLIDWESSFNYGELSWEALLATKPSEPILMRLLMQGFQASEEKPLVTLKLGVPNETEGIVALLRTDTPEESKFRNLISKQAPKPMTIRLMWNPEVEAFDLELNVTRPITGGDELTITDNSHIRARTKSSNWSGLTEAFFTVNGIASLLPTDITISEIHYNPDGGSENAEFIELLNTGTRPVNLRNAKFADGITYDFPHDWDTIIHPGKRLVIVGSLYDMNILHGLDLPIAGIHQGNFNNGGEQITLIDENLVVLSELTFTDLSPWPTAPDGDGPSLTLIGDGPTNDPSSWRSSLVVNGTPGGDDETTFAGEPLADDDGNGLSNLLEHALGNTLVASKAFPVITNVSYDDGTGLKNYLGVSYRANLSDPNLNFIIEVSPDLQNWSDGPTTTQLVERVDQGDGTANFIVRSITPVTELAHQFIRLKVNHTP